jgi:hypothetical protein
MATTKVTEADKAKAVIELAKSFVPSAILAQGTLPSGATQQEVVAYFERSVNISFSLAGLFRKKSKEVIDSAIAADNKTETPNAI